MHKCTTLNTYSPKDKYVVIITGPTAVGKSALCLQLAQELDAEIFSADSRQVYKEMSIGTAVPSSAELAEVKHHFIQHRSIEDGYSVGDYFREMEDMLSTYFETKDIAIVTGGTGLYINALMKGLNDFPEVAPEIVAELEMIYQRHGIEPLQEELAQEDPTYYANVDQQNHTRLIRALSIIRASGEPYSSFIADESKGLPYTFVPVLLERDREQLYERINERVLQMMKQGLLQEAKSLYPKRDLKALQTVGYSEIFEHLDGLYDIVAAVELIQRNTRRYAKRQLTWNRKQDWPRYHPEQQEEILNRIRDQIKL